MRPQQFLISLVCILIAYSGVVACSSLNSGSDPHVIGALPNRVTAPQGSFLIIEGDHFNSRATATLGSDRLQFVTWVNAAVLTAQVPPGLAPGSYDLSVSNPGGGHYTLPKAITVVGATGSTPAPTAVPAQPHSPTAAPTATPVRASATASPTPAPRTPTPAPPTRTPAATASPTVVRTATPQATRASAPLSNGGPNLTGDWTITDTVTYGIGQGQTYSFVVSLHQAPGLVTGIGGGLQINGVFDGQTFQATYVQDNGSVGNFYWTVDATGNVLSGTFSNSSGNGGTSVAQRAPTGQNQRPAPAPQPRNNAARNQGNGNNEN
jgi:hypothetical protein